jgi:hypothetical protein
MRRETIQIPGVFAGTRHSTGPLLTTAESAPLAANCGVRRYGGHRKTTRSDTRPKAALCLATAAALTMSGCLAADDVTGAASDDRTMSEAELSTGAAAGSRAELDAFTPLVSTPLASSRPVLTTDGARHLLYELQFTNVTGSAATITEVQALDAASGEALVTLTGASLAERAPAAVKDGTVVLGGGLTAFLFMDVAVRPEAPLPQRLIHVFSIGLSPDNPTVAHRFRSGAVEVRSDELPVLGPPLRGAGWVAVNGCCDVSSGHRTAIPPLNGAFHLAQRFAIDFTQLQPDGRLLAGPPEALASYRAYGAPVLAVAVGVVVRARDGVSDNVPVGEVPSQLTPDIAAGNHVVLDIGGGRFVLYAHLQPGSLRVRTGQRVASGDVLGLVGNTGNSDFPHLHIHVMDGRSPLGSDGLPYVFRAFRSVGTVANPDEVLSGAPARFAGSSSGSFTGRLPLDLQEVSF